MDDETLRARLEDNCAWLVSMAHRWQQLAAEHDPALARFVAASEGAVSGPAVDLSPLTFAPLAHV